MIDLTIKIGGEAGFGIMTTGLFLGKIATRSGYHAFEYSEYPSLIRGGHNVVAVRISDKKIYSQEEKTDILVCLNKKTYLLHASEVKKGGIILGDETVINRTSEINKGEKILNLPFSSLLKEQNFSKVMMNNIALGTLVYLLGADFSVLTDLITENFRRKGEEVVKKNLQAAKVGYEFGKKNYPKRYKINLPLQEKIIPRLYLSGNEVIGLGSIAAECRFYCAYPMTPTSNLLHYLASQSEKSKMVVKHAEDEIAVVNMALGASWAGVRSMVGTSGGGYALMVEATSLAGMTELPLVIVMGQRPGPATGMPTWTEQGDLLFIIHSGHGEFPKIVLAPGDMEEAYRLTITAFNLADKYQTPVFILADKYLLEGRQSIDKSQILDFEFSIDRGKLLTQDKLLEIKNYKRYQITEDGISPRAIPGMRGALHQVNSYEHLEDGHTTEDANERKKQVEKRNRKKETFLTNDFQLPRLYGPQKADLTLVSWGSMKGPILQVIEDSHGAFNYLHFSYLWPLSKERLMPIFRNCKKLLLVENNSTGQFGQLLTMVTGIEIEERLLKYSGRPIYPEEILARIKIIK